jgi:hypothetical protein
MSLGEATGHDARLELGGLLSVEGGLRQVRKILGGFRLGLFRGSVFVHPLQGNTVLSSRLDGQSPSFAAVVGYLDSFGLEPKVGLRASQHLAAIAGRADFSNGVSLTKPVRGAPFSAAPACMRVRGFRRNQSRDGGGRGRDSGHLARSEAD